MYNTPNFDKCIKSKYNFSHLDKKGAFLRSQKISFMFCNLNIVSCKKQACLYASFFNMLFIIYKFVKEVLL